MKHNKWLKLAIVAGCSLTAFAQGNSTTNPGNPKTALCQLAEQTTPEPADAIVGTWVNEKGGRTMEIYKTGTGYFGKIVSDDSGKVKPGTDILLDLRFADNAWRGKLFLPARNETVNATLKLRAGQLEITAGKGLFSEKRTWKRA